MDTVICVKNLVQHWILRAWKWIKKKTENEEEEQKED